MPGSADICNAMTAGRADHAGLEVVESDLIGQWCSKRRDRPYRGGRSPDWTKVKNRKHPAMERVMEAIR